MVLDSRGDIGWGPVMQERLPQLPCRSPPHGDWEPGATWPLPASCGPQFPHLCSNRHSRVLQTFRPHASSLSVPQTARNSFPPSPSLAHPPLRISPHPLPGYSHSCLPHCPMEGQRTHSLSHAPVSTSMPSSLSLPQCNTTNVSGRSVWGISDPPPTPASLLSESDHLTVPSLHPSVAPTALWRRNSRFPLHSQMLDLIPDPNSRIDHR